MALNTNSQLELSDGSLRQRRNLLVVSLLLILLDQAEISFGNTISVQGLVLKVGNPEVIFLLLHVMLLYFAWRYYQYFTLDNVYSSLKSQYRDLRKTIKDRGIVKEIFRQYPKLTGLKGSYKYSDLKKSGHHYYTISADTNDKEVFPRTPYIVRINRWLLDSREIVALIIFVMRGRILTDYYLPFGVGLYALAAKFV